MVTGDKDFMQLVDDAGSEDVEPALQHQRPRRSSAPSRGRGEVRGPARPDGRLPRPDGRLVGQHPGRPQGRARRPPRELLQDQFGDPGGGPADQRRGARRSRRLAQDPGRERGRARRDVASDLVTIRTDVDTGLDVSVEDLGPAAGRTARSLEPVFRDLEFDSLLKSLPAGAEVEQLPHRVHGWSRSDEPSWTSSSTALGRAERPWRSPSTPRPPASTRMRAELQSASSMSCEARAWPYVRAVARLDPPVARRWCATPSWMAKLRPLLEDSGIPPKTMQ